MKLEELEKYRTSEGYIDIDKIGFIAKQEDREYRGSNGREKEG